MPPKVPPPAKPEKPKPPAPKPAPPPSREHITVNQSAASLVLMATANGYHMLRGPKDPPPDGTECCESLLRELLTSVKAMVTERHEQTLGSRQAFPANVNVLPSRNQTRLPTETARGIRTIHQTWASRNPSPPQSLPGLVLTHPQSEYCATLIMIGNHD